MLLLSYCYSCKWTRVVVCGFLSDPVFTTLMLFTSLIWNKYNPINTQVLFNRVPAVHWFTKNKKDESALCSAAQLRSAHLLLLTECRSCNSLYSFHCVTHVWIHLVSEPSNTVIKHFVRSVLTAAWFMLTVRVWPLTSEHCCCDEEIWH